MMRVFSIKVLGRLSPAYLFVTITKTNRRKLITKDAKIVQTNKARCFGGIGKLFWLGAHVQNSRQSTQIFIEIRLINRPRKHCTHSHNWWKTFGLEEKGNVGWKSRVLLRRKKVNVRNTHRTSFFAHKQTLHYAQQSTSKKNPINWRIKCNTRIESRKLVLSRNSRCIHTR